MDRSRHRAISKAMSWLLRHEAERLELGMDPEGYVPLAVLVRALNTHAGLTVEEDDVRSVVAEGDPVKQRYSLIDDWVRANYGHSLAGEIAHEATNPPDMLYHGTSEQTLPAIRMEGLKPMLRQYVHLTTDPELARSVGSRHGRAQVLIVDSQRAHAAGIAFYRANDRFWLARAVPAEFVRT